jgi:hypothetical protein
MSKRDTFVKLEERGSNTPLGALNYESGRIVGKLDIVANHVELVILVFVILILGGLVTLLVMSGITFSHIDINYDGTKCPSDGPCTAGVVTGTAADRYCDQRNRPADWKCNSRCYNPGVAGVCNGKGACVANWTLSRAYCPNNHDTSTIYDGDFSRCAEAFPFWPYYTDSDNVNPEDASIFAGLALPSCYANECIMITLDAQLNIFDVEGGFDIDIWAASLGISCHDMLDTRNATLDTGCITAHETLLDSSFVTPYINNVLTGLVTLPGNWTARTCVFRYTNAQSNTTHFFDAIDVSANSLSVSNVTTPTGVHARRRRTIGLPEPRRLPTMTRVSNAEIINEMLPALIQANADKFVAIVKRSQQ